MTYSRRIDRDYVTSLHASIKHTIPSNMCIIGENLTAVHSIKYSRLSDRFLVFAIRTLSGYFLSWAGTKGLCAKLGLKTVPVLYQGIWDTESITACYTGKSRYGGKQEGFVLRNSDHILVSNFGNNVAKFVRADHVQVGGDHWTKKQIIFNKVKNN